MQNQKKKETIEVDSQPLNDSDINLVQIQRNPSSTSPEEDVLPKEFFEFVKNLDEIKKDGYYLEKAMATYELVSLEDMVVLRNVMKQFETRLKQEAELADLNVAGAGTNGVVFVLDVDEDDLVHPKLIVDFTPKLPPKKTKKPISQDDSNGVNVNPHNPTQSKPNQGITLEQPLEQKDHVSDQLDTNTSVHSTESQNTILKKPIIDSFAAKKSLFFARSKNVKQQDYQAIYNKNQGLVREFEAMTVVKTRDPLNLFYVRNFGVLDITRFVKELNLGNNFPKLQNNVVPLDHTKGIYGNIAFSVMSYNPFDLETFLVNLDIKKSMMFYHTFLQMMLNLLNGLIIMNFEFYHCDLKPLNIMFRPLKNAPSETFDKEIPWINTVTKKDYDIFRINPNNITEKFDGNSIIAYPMELFPGEHFLMSIIDIGNDSWHYDHCKRNKYDRFYRQCTTVSPKYAPIEFRENTSKIPGFDVFSVSMMFTEMLMAEAGFGGFGLWNAAFILMKLEAGDWSHYSGRAFAHFNNVSRSNRSSKTQIKRCDTEIIFQTVYVSILEKEPMYLHVKQIWDGTDFELKKELVGKFEKAVKAMGEYNEFYDVFSISESSDVQDDTTLENLKFDSFLYLNRSQFRYFWLVLLQYFWDNLFLQASTEEINKMFKIKSNPMGMKRSTSPFSDSSFTKVKVHYPSLTDGLDEDVLEVFVDEVLEMKRDLLPLKHHMGIILFGILKEIDSKKRPSLKDLRDLVQGQYYTIIAQGPETFGVEPQKNDTENPDSSQQQDLLSTSAKQSAIPDGLKFNFNLDYIVKTRRKKHVITIENGEAVTPKGKFGGGEFNSGTMIRRGTEQYKKANQKLNGETSKIKKLFSDNKLTRQFKSLGKKIKCLLRSKNNSGNSGQFGQSDSDESIDIIEPDETDSRGKII
jgi:hypothetical protein